MNTNLSFAMNQETNESLVPPQMLRAGSATVRSMIDFMLLYGVDKLDVCRHTHGKVMLISPKMRMIKGIDIPEWVEGSRKQAIYHLSHLMFIMGILGIEVILDESEIKDIQARWRSCEKLEGVQDSSQLEQLLAPDDRSTDDGV